jgi:hypothetical protein
MASAACRAVFAAAVLLIPAGGTLLCAFHFASYVLDIASGATVGRHPPFCGLPANMPTLRPIPAGRKIRDCIQSYNSRTFVRKPIDWLEFWKIVLDAVHNGPVDIRQGRDQAPADERLVGTQGRKLHYDCRDCTTVYRQRWGA